MKKGLLLVIWLLIVAKTYAQSSVILPNGTVISSFTQATRPANPVIGQLIYQTDGTSGLYIWNGSAWTAVSTGNGGGGNGTVTNVTANSPLSVTNGSTTPAITIQQANGTTNGFLSNTDWTTFNNKQSLLSNANTTTSGILTSTDWNTFNNKFSLPSLTSGSLLFSDGSTISQNNSNLYWNNESSSLGIGTNSPASRLHISGADWNSSLRISSASGVGAGIFFNGNNRNWAIIGTNTGAGAGNQKLGFYDATSQEYRMVIDSTGNIGLGVLNPLVKFDVNGVGGIKVSTTNNGTGTFDWVSGNFGAATGDRVVIGLNDGRATIGAHNNMLNSWASFGINVGGGNVGVGTPSPATALHVKSNGSGAILNLEGVSQSYMQFYPNGYNAGRKGWFGFGSDDTEMSIVNEKAGGNIVLLPGSNAKVGIGTSLPENSALLDVNSSIKGFLPPRMTYSQRNAIANPADGLMVYQTDSSAGMYYYSRGFWNQLVYNSFPQLFLKQDTVRFSGNTIKYLLPKGIGRVWITLKGGKGGNGQSAYYQDPTGYLAETGNYNTPYTTNFNGNHADRISGNFMTTPTDSLLIITIGQSSSNVYGETNLPNGTVFSGGWPNGKNGGLTVTPISETRSYTYFCGSIVVRYCTADVNYYYNSKFAASGGGGGSKIALNDTSNVIISAKGGNGAGEYTFGLGGGATFTSNLVQGVENTPSVSDNSANGYAIISYYISNANQNILNNVSNSITTNSNNNSRISASLEKNETKKSFQITNLKVNIPAALYSTNANVSGSNLLKPETTEVIWRHNLGYKPEIIISKQQSDDTSNMEFVSTSYYHVDDNMIRIRCSNVGNATANGILKILVID